MERWQNQEEALQFALGHKSVMLDMDMGTGKTRVAIDTIMADDECKRVLVVCPKAVIPVWRTNLQKFYYGDPNWVCWEATGDQPVTAKALKMAAFLEENKNRKKAICVVNYDIVWRGDIGNFVLGAGFDTVILDESHRAKAAGSKVSKYLAMLGKRARRKMCLSGTPMANSPLDVYGQYRFLDPSIFGSNHARFLQRYAIMGGPEGRFVVGVRNMEELNRLFSSIAYTCDMDTVKGRLSLPDRLPPTTLPVTLPSSSTKMLKSLQKDFIAECSAGHVVVANVLVKMLRMQQITSGFVEVEEDFSGSRSVTDLNTAKADTLTSLLEDVSPRTSVVVFCVFQHDLDVVAVCAEKAKKRAFELSGRRNELEQWKEHGGVLAVQIQAGAEGVDMTKSHLAVYFSLPHSLALYEQSKARLYRPGQTSPVSFVHLIAEGTIDEAMYKSLINKRDAIDAVKSGTLDVHFGQ